MRTLSESTLMVIGLFQSLKDNEGIIEMQLEDLVAFVEENKNSTEVDMVESVDALTDVISNANDYNSEGYGCYIFLNELRKSVQVFRKDLVDKFIKPMVNIIPENEIAKTLN